MPVPAGSTPPLITTDVSTPVGLVRLLISDLNDAAPIFSDPEIGAFIGICGGNVRKGAASALDAMASNESMVSKVIRTLDLQVDGTKVAADLRSAAAQLRADAENYLADGMTLWTGEIVDFRPYEWWRHDHELAEPEWSGWCG